jgi:hypothetical protein
MILGPFAFDYSELEKKLLTLGLNHAASEGEIQNSAVALIRALRSRGIGPEEICRGSELPAPPKRPAFDPGAVRMPWGKHQGKRLREIPPKYLRFVLWKCVNADPDLLDAIRAYLRQVRAG